MSKSPRLQVQVTDGPLAYEFTIHRAAAKESAHSSHVFVEFLQSLLSNADVGFWEKFEAEVSPEMYFSAMLKSLAQAWVCQYWDGEDDEESKSLSLHRIIDEMLIHLNKTGHLPEKIDSPWEEEDDDDNDDDAKAKSKSRN